MSNQIQNLPTEKSGSRQAIGTNVKKNEKQLDFLKRLIKNNRLPHAMIFSGPAGLGKKETALKFAELLGAKDDAIVLDPEGEEIKIEEIRHLGKELILTPRLSSFKFVVINKAERMNFEAQNSLLKTLEEPRLGTILILIARKIGVLLPTIRSRCVILRFYHYGFSFFGEKNFKEIGDLFNQDTVGRFSFCRSFFKKGEERNINDFLFRLESFLRLVFLQKLGVENWELKSYNFKMPEKNVLQMTEILKKVGEYKEIVLGTNVNPRLALENLMLNI